MAKLTDQISNDSYDDRAGKVVVLGKDGIYPATPSNPLPVDANVTVDTMNLTAEMKVDSGHDLYEATNVVRTANLAVSFDAVVGLTLAKIQSVENKTKGWIYNTKGATVTNTTITLVAANQNAGYPVIAVADQVEVIYRGDSRFTVAKASDVKTPDSKVLVVQNIDASGNIGGGSSPSTTSEYRSPTHFSAAYTSNVTITLSGVNFTISDSSQLVYVRVTPATGDSKIFVNGSGGVTLRHTANVITISGAGTPFAAGDVYEVGINGTTKAYDSSTDANKTISLVNVWNRYTDPEVLVTAQDLTNAYADFGAEIDMRGYTHLGVYIVTDVNDSETVTLKLLGKHTSAGTDEYEINGGTTQALWTTGASDAKLQYEFDVKGVPFIQLQAIAGTVGATAGDLTVYITKQFKN